AVRNGTSLFITCQQTLRNFDHLFRCAVLTACLLERDPLDGAVASNADAPTQQRVTRDLAGHTAAVELEDNFVPRYFTKVSPITGTFFMHTNFRELDLRDQARSPAPIQIENCDWLSSGITQLFRRQHGSQMIARRHI